MPELVSCCHVLVQCHLHASLRRQHHITDVAQLAANQAPDGICQRVQEVVPVETMTLFYEMRHLCQGYNSRCLKL